MTVSEFIGQELNKEQAVAVADIAGCTIKFLEDYWNLEFSKEYVIEGLEYSEGSDCISLYGLIDAIQTGKYEYGKARGKQSLAFFYRRMIGAAEDPNLTIDRFL